MIGTFRSTWCQPLFPEKPEKPEKPETPGWSRVHGVT